ncbi:MAG TPA: hypothetical protein VGE38_03550 [Nocardioides sp.]|uniref:hypothetical protein n=1 Tax=Nocardioides sp. TaxID=35761 RepID=UPI002ED8C7C6
MKIRILRVLSVRANGPGVVAFVDDQLVKWNPKRGWITECDCEGDEDTSCPHVDALLDVLDPRVMGATA